MTSKKLVVLEENNCHQEILPCWIELATLLKCKIDIYATNRHDIVAYCKGTFPAHEESITWRPPARFSAELLKKEQVECVILNSLYVYHKKTMNCELLAHCNKNCIPCVCLVHDPQYLGQLDIRACLHTSAKTTLLLFTCNYGHRWYLKTCAIPSIQSDWILPLHTSVNRKIEVMTNENADRKYRFASVGSFHPNRRCFKDIYSAIEVDGGNAVMLGRFIPKYSQVLENVFNEFEDLKKRVDFVYEPAFPELFDFLHRSDIMLTFSNAKRYTTNAVSGSFLLAMCVGMPFTVAKENVTEIAEMIGGDNSIIVEQKTCNFKNIVDSQSLFIEEARRDLSLKRSEQIERNAAILNAFIHSLTPSAPSIASVFTIERNSCATNSLDLT